MQVEEVPNRPMMMRVVAGRRPRPRNEDLAIVTISPLPGNLLHFPTVEEVVRELLETRMRIPVREVQPCHLGQAFVRFENDIDRDRVVLRGPIPFGGVNFTFVRHNQGRNWRRVNFNQDCWLMLLGFPNDYWEQEYVDTVLGPFGKSVSWVANEDHLTYLLVKARVIDLESVPHFIVFSDAEGYAGDSWTVQCEILQHEHLGEGPPEGLVPVQVEGQGPPQFDFFGLGQQVLGPVPQLAQPEQPQIEPAPEEIAPEQGQEQPGEAWFDWPEELPAAGQAFPAAGQVLQNADLPEMEIDQQLNLNEAPVVMLQDLNEAPVQEDPQEMLIHPVNVQAPEEILENIPQPVVQQPEFVAEEIADNLVQFAE